MNDFREQRTPLPMRGSRDLRINNGISYDLVGIRKGKLIVLGVSDVDTKIRWVCKCVCGTYTIRSTKAINSDRNIDDCCQSCKRIKYHDKLQYFKNHGTLPDGRK